MDQNFLTYKINDKISFIPNSNEAEDLKIKVEKMNGIIIAEISTNLKLLYNIFCEKYNIIFHDIPSQNISKIII